MTLLARNGMSGEIPLRAQARDGATLLLEALDLRDELAVEFLELLVVGDALPAGFFVFEHGGDVLEGKAQRCKRFDAEKADEVVHRVFAVSVLRALRLMQQADLAVMAKRPDRDARKIGYFFAAHVVR